MPVEINDPALDNLIRQILSAPKEVVGGLHWSTTNRADTAVCKRRVVCRDFPKAYLRLVLTVNRRKLPHKGSFTLLLGDKRIFCLDVEPRRWHNNGAGFGSVRATHWSVWPCRFAEQDDRRLSHREWFDEFNKRAHASFTGRYRKPPYEPEQMKLL